VIDNPMFKEYQNIKDLHEIQDYSWSPPKHDDPEKHIDYSSGKYTHCSCSYHYRRVLAEKYSYAIPNEEAIREVVRLSPIVEIGAGTGYWASLINSAGGVVVAYDKAPVNSKIKNYYKFTDQHFRVKRGGPSVLSRYPDHTLLLCWPPYGKPMAKDCLNLYKGNTVVYVGEGDSGCTGDEKFHDALEAEWVLKKEIDIPQWSGIHDTMMIYTRR
jgi:hypothetical protein